MAVDPKSNRSARESCCAVGLPIDAFADLHGWTALLDGKDVDTLGAAGTLLLAVTLPAIDVNIWDADLYADALLPSMMAGTAMVEDLYWIVPAEPETDDGIAWIATDVGTS